MGKKGNSSHKLDADNRRWKRLVDEEGSIKLDEPRDVARVDRKFWKVSETKVASSCDTQEKKGYEVIVFEKREAVLSCPAGRYTCDITVMTHCANAPVTITVGNWTGSGSRPRTLRRVPRGATERRAPVEPEDR